MNEKQELFHSTVTFTGLGEARIDNLTQQQAWQVADVMRLIERKPPSYSENGVLLYSVTTVTTDVVAEGRAISARAGFLSRLFRRLNAWMMGGALLLLLIPVLSAPASAQELKTRANPNGPASGLSGVRRNDRAVTELLDEQLKCLADIAARRKAGEPAKAECPALDAFVDRTPLCDLFRYDGAFTLEEERAIKYALIEAAYFGYQHAQRKRGSDD